MIYSFLLIGQSNMGGRGTIGEVPEIEDVRMLMMRNARWLTLSEPVNPDRKFSGINLSTTFAKGFIDDNLEDCCAVIPCADGGTCIDEWQKGGPLYEHALFCTRQAMKTSTLSGILWHQGESDCSDERWPYYTEKFLKMLNDLTKDLGVEDIPVLVGGLGDYLTDVPSGAFVKYKEINKQLIDLSEKYDNIYYVSAKNLGCRSDYLHFHAKALREFGYRYYDAYKNKKSIYDEDISNGILENQQGEDKLLKELNALDEREKRGEITKEEAEKLRTDLIRNA